MIVGHTAGGVEVADLAPGFAGPYALTREQWEECSRRQTAQEQAEAVLRLIRVATRDVSDFGSNTDDAIARALDAMPPGGGRLRFTGGWFRTKRTVDLTGRESVWLSGAGARHTVIESTADVAIAATSTQTRFGRLSDFSLRHTSGQRGGGGIGVSVVGSAAQFTVERLDVRFFAQGYALSGPTGPIRVRDCDAIDCGRGYVFSAIGEDAPQDVTIDGGHVHDCHGGFLVEKAMNLKVQGVDVELGEHALYPALHATGILYAATLLGNTFSVGESDGAKFAVTPNAVVAFEAEGPGATGCVVIGGLNYAYHGGVNLRLAGIGHSLNLVTGGQYHNRADGGYFATVEGATQTAFFYPRLTGHGPGKNKVDDSLAHNVTALGVETVRGTGFTTPSIATDAIRLGGLELYVEDGVVKAR